MNLRPLGARDRAYTAVNLDYAAAIDHRLRYEAANASRSAVLDQEVAGNGAEGGPGARLKHRDITRDGAVEDGVPRDRNRSQEMGMNNFHCRKLHNRQAMMPRRRGAVERHSA
jgi:hypothetical protein